MVAARLPESRDFVNMEVSLFLGLLSVTKILSQSEAEELCQIGQGRGRDHVTRLKSLTSC